MNDKFETDVWKGAVTSMFRNCPKFLMQQIRKTVENVG